MIGTLNNHQGRKPLIELSGIGKTYKTASETFEALKVIDLTFYKGEFVGVIGKSGSGKSTLVNMITGIDRPTVGKVIVDGLDIHAMKESKLARWRGVNMGVVFQFFQLLPMLTLLENVMLPMDFCSMYQPEERFERAMNLLEMVGLGDDAHKLPGSVSGGQQQSAAIARALANDPLMIIADEPTGNLDARTADAVYDKFENLAGEGRTIIMITHDPEIENRLSRKVLLSDGELIDPLLTLALPWIPSGELRVLSDNLIRKKFMQDELLDVRDTFAHHLILLEEGKIQLTYHKTPRKGETFILSPGMCFAGQAVVRVDLLKHFSAKPLTSSVKVALIEWDDVLSVLSRVTGGLEKLHKVIRENMQGQGASQKEGLI